jgi:hypothetical protein
LSRPVSIDARPGRGHAHLRGRRLGKVACPSCQNPSTMGCSNEFGVPAFPHRIHDAPAMRRPLRDSTIRTLARPASPSASRPVDETTSTGNKLPTPERGFPSTRRRSLSSVATAKPRCRQNASRFNPHAANS